MSDGDNCKIKPGRWGLYVHHDCRAHKYDSSPEYIPGTFDSRDKKACEEAMRRDEEYMRAQDALSDTNV